MGYPSCATLETAFLRFGPDMSSNKMEVFSSRWPRHSEDSFLPPDDLNGSKDDLMILSVFLSVVTDLKKHFAIIIRSYLRHLGKRQPEKSGMWCGPDQKKLGGEFNRRARGSWRP